MGAEVGGDGEVAVERRRAQLALESSQIRRLPPNKRKCLLSQIVSPSWQRSFICRLPCVSSRNRLKASRCQLSTPRLPLVLLFLFSPCKSHGSRREREREKDFFLSAYFHSTLFISRDHNISAEGGACCAGETYSDQGSSAPRREHRHSSGDDAAGHRVACRSWWKSQALCGAVGKQELSVSSRDELRIRHGVRVEGKGKRGKKQGPVSRSVSEVGVAVFSSSEVRMRRENPGARKKKIGTGTGTGEWRL